MEVGGNVGGESEGEEGRVMERRGGEDEEKWDWMKGVVRGEREGGGGRGVGEEISERSYLHIGRAMWESWKGMRIKATSFPYHVAWE